MMKKIIALCVLGVLSTFSLGLLAETAVKDAQPSDAEITLNFFKALSTCTPGHYQEKNILASQVGPAMLSHIIDGEDKNLCSVILSTADGRSVNCDFNMADIAGLSEQHFLIGILTNNYENPSKESLKSDQIWTDLKTNSCGF